MKEDIIFYELLSLINDEEIKKLVFAFRSSKENEQKSLLVHYLKKYKKSLSYLN